jgi:hypothetical protein
MSTPLVFLGGSARSGSTLLERMLSRIPGSCSVGELAFFWDRCVIRNDRCGCGARFHDCPFWQQVGKAAFGGWDQIDAARAAQLHATLDRHRNLDRLSGLRGPGHLSATLDSYLGMTDQLYAAIRDVSGASVIIDSSKQVGYALLLRDLPSVDLRLLHLVRRSHGVAYSWSKRVRATAVGDGTGLMSRHSPLWAVSLWMADNLLYDAIARQVPRATRVRYEDIVVDPRAALVKIVGDLELPAADLALSYLDDSAAELTTSHALSGNPMRFQQGRVVLRADEEWRSRMSRPRQAAISAATWPLLMRYGYWPAAAPKQHP